uniref:helix-turn-helix domain-containing protein n=1 Tax=Nonomuraea sp. CA-251285 TaxID=3240002 RepID=UPI003F496DC3
MAAYRELADIIDTLPLLLMQERRVRGMTMTAAADQIGLSHATVSRIETGGGFHADSAAAVLRWLGSPPADGSPGRER